MIRLFHAVAAVAASSSFVYGVAPGVQTQHPEHAPQVIGADKPVFLGRMVVTATPLPPR